MIGLNWSIGKDWFRLKHLQGSVETMVFNWYLGKYLLIIVFYSLNIDNYWLRVSKSCSIPYRLNIS